MIGLAWLYGASLNLIFTGPYTSAIRYWMADAMNVVGYIISVRKAMALGVLLMHVVYLFDSVPSGSKDEHA